MLYLGDGQYGIPLLQFLTYPANLIMKMKVITFCITAVLCTSVIPVFNILFVPDINEVEWKKKEFLYNMDLVDGWISEVLYRAGISTDSEQVIVGRDRWLFLGDKYEHGLSADRSLPSDTDILHGQYIGAASKAWDSYFSNNGVKLYRVMLVPNKGAIYPEYLPHWAVPSHPNPTDALMAGTGSATYIDLRQPLLSAKEKQATALYYKTDSHWNMLGAATAFHAFSEQVGKSVPELRWPSESMYELVRTEQKNGGDLAKFLRITEYVHDAEPHVRISDSPVETSEYDYDTNQLLHQGGFPTLGATAKPVLVKSQGALNNKKVLWLRDSTGNALAPWMAATFSDVLQLSWIRATSDGVLMTRLIDQWKPDYVIYTVVERDSKVANFAHMPPSDEDS